MSDIQTRTVQVTDLTGDDVEPKPARPVNGEVQGWLTEINGEQVGPWPIEWAETIDLVEAEQRNLQITVWIGTGTARWMVGIDLADQSNFTIADRDPRG